MAAIFWLCLLTTECTNGALMGKNTTSNPEVKNARADWDINPTWTTTFCNLCVEQIQAENRTKGVGFSTKGDWRVWEQLRNRDTGLGWDAVKGTIAATNDWWDRKLKELPKAKKFREKATGVAAWTPSSNTLPPTMLEEGAGDSDGSSEFKDNQCDMSLDIDSLQQRHTNQLRSSRQKRTSESIPLRRKRRR
ncbi:uncharacterized protein LOC115972960 [Quercus lobata]|uniref:uncharacterized protein LOC115972960 n=1 Tax=Quercus lobata TaxID=97700 RepID=UPI001245B118|nr:uncharacterized protein LOC115972960 [Quercus lobata]